MLLSHGKLRFSQDIEPTNQTSVLCKRLHAGLSGLDLEEQKAEYNNRRREAVRESQLRVRRVIGMVPSQETDEDEGSRYCYRCSAHWDSYGHYPHEAELLRLSEKASMIPSYRDDPPPPGYCQNPECGHEGDSLWHWSVAHGFYLSDACKAYTRDNNEEL